MWQYQKRLQYPVNIKATDPRLAQLIIAQYGGPNGELVASLRYLSQRYSMPDEVTKGLLTDIGMSCLKCSHTSQTVPVRNSVPHSTCVGANLNKHQFSPCYVLLFFRPDFYRILRFFPLRIKFSLYTRIHL